MQINPVDSKTTIQITVGIEKKSFNTKETFQFVFQMWVSWSRTVENPSLTSQSLREVALHPAMLFRQRQVENCR